MIFTKSDTGRVSIVIHKSDYGEFIAMLVNSGYIQIDVDVQDESGTIEEILTRYISIDPADAESLLTTSTEFLNSTVHIISETSKGYSFALL